MKTLLFALSIAFLFPLSSQAQTDACCVMSSETGNKVTTTTSYMAPGKCKPGSESGGMKMCAEYKGEEDTFCSTGSEENKKLRCNKCGYVWIDGLCFVKDPVEIAKEELAAKEKDKDKEKKKKEEAQK